MKTYMEYVETNNMFLNELLRDFLFFRQFLETAIKPYQVNATFI